MASEAKKAGQKLKSAAGVSGKPDRRTDCILSKYPVWTVLAESETEKADQDMVDPSSYLRSLLGHMIERATIEEQHGFVLACPPALHARRKASSHWHSVRRDGLPRGHLAQHLVGGRGHCA